MWQTGCAVLGKWFQWPNDYLRCRRWLRRPRHSSACTACRSSQDSPPPNKAAASGVSQSSYWRACPRASPTSSRSRQLLRQPRSPWWAQISLVNTILLWGKGSWRSVRHKPKRRESWLRLATSFTRAHLSAGVTYLVPMGLRTRPLKRWLSRRQRTRPFRASLRPVQRFGSQWPSSHMARGHGNFTHSTASSDAALLLAVTYTYIHFYFEWNSFISTLLNVFGSHQYQPFKYQNSNRYPLKTIMRDFCDICIAKTDIVIPTNRQYIVQAWSVSLTHNRLPV